MKNKIEIVQKRISDDHLDSYWYDGLIAVGNHYEVRALGSIKHEGDKPKDDNELSMLYEEGAFSLNNWFEVSEIDTDTGEVYGTYDEAIEALITAEKEFETIKYIIKMHSNEDDFNEHYLMYEFLVMSDKEETDEYLQQVCVDRYNSKEETDYTITDLYWDIQSWDGSIEVIDLRKKLK